MTSLRFAPIDEETADLLALVSDPHTVTRKPLADIFRAACRAEAEANDGWVDPNRVRARVLEAFAASLVECDDPEMNHRQYSALWSTAAKRDGGYLDTTDVPVAIDPKNSRGNGGKGTTYRRWRDWTPETPGT